MVDIKDIECMYCKKWFVIEEIHKSGYCRECIDKLRAMYKEVVIPYTPVDEKVRKQWEKRRLQQLGLWQLYIDQELEKFTEETEEAKENSKKHKE
jgi:hypothetical protein